MKFIYMKQVRSLNNTLQLDEKEIQLHEQKKNAKKTVKKLQTQLSQEKERRKRSYEEAVGNHRTNNR